LKKIGISGVPGSGKTSLARSLSSSCRKIKGVKSVELISEYARNYISKHSAIEHIWEQYRVTEKQIEWEDNICPKTDVLITDSPIYLGFFYAINLVDFRNSKDILIYNDLFKKLSNLNKRYDLLIHLEPVIEVVDDGIRPELHFDSKWREESNSMILNVFSLFGQKDVIKISTVDMSERVETCLDLLRKTL